MKINRIGNERNINQDADVIEVCVGDFKYSITQYFGSLKIHAHGSRLEIIPCVSNVIEVKGYD